MKCIYNMVNTFSPCIYYHMFGSTVWGGNPDYERFSFWLLDFYIRWKLKMFDKDGFLFVEFKIWVVMPH